MRLQCVSIASSTDEELLSIQCLSLCSTCLLPSASSSLSSASTYASKNASSPPLRETFYSRNLLVTETYMAKFHYVDFPVTPATSPLAQIPLRRLPRNFPGRRNGIWANGDFTGLSQTCRGRHGKVGFSLRMVSASYGVFAECQ